MTSTPVTIEWSNEHILHFLSIYQKYPVIWDPRDYNNKNRRVLANAWIAIKEELGTNLTINEIKRKKESLMAIYRNLRKKVLNSMKTCTTVHDIYKPTWFAYDLMNSFLEKRKKITKTVNITPVDDIEQDVRNQPFHIEYIPDENTEAYKSRVQSKVKRNGSNGVDAHYKKLRPSFETNEITNKTITNETTNKKAYDLIETVSHKLCEEENDECALYGKILALKLRSLSRRNRKMLINEIDNLVFQTEMKEIDGQSDEPQEYKVSSVMLEDPLKYSSSSSFSISDLSDKSTL